MLMPPSIFSEERQLLELESPPPRRMEPKSRLIPQLLLPQSHNISLPGRFHVSKMSLSPMSDMLRMIGGHLLTTLDSGKVIPKL